ncbi:kinase-like domain-containing protein, partial [Hyaloscypha finlandica]
MEHSQRGFPGIISQAESKIAGDGAVQPNMSTRGPNPGTDDVSILNLLDVTTSNNIPFIDISRIGVPENSRTEGVRRAHIIGSGLTATVVRHVVNSDGLDLGADDTLVALKIFSPKPPGDGDLVLPITNYQEDFRAIMREIKILSDPEVSKHPNIVNLLFVGQQIGNPLPVLGIELGSFGSLEYILTAPGYSLSLLQRQNVMVDITLGLHCLHRLEIYHGDLKPDNILIMWHPDDRRQLIAKISDFGGCCRRGTDDRVPIHATKLWLAPEVLHDAKDIDWGLADVYSYALIAVSIWIRPFLPSIDELKSSCFLAQLIPDFPDQEDFYCWLLIVKSLGLQHEHSVFNLALGVTSDRGREFVQALGPLLNPRFWERPNLTTIIMDIILPLTSNLGGRNINDELQRMCPDNT